MGVDATVYECSRCGTEFSMRADHTEIVRRDFVEAPRPARIDRLCVDCWEAYVTEFLGRNFDALRDGYRTD